MILKRYTPQERQWLIACFAAYTAAYISRCNLSPSLDAIAKTFGVTAAQAGLLPTCFALPYAMGQIFSGYLADRYPAPRLMAAGLLGSAAVNVLFSFCHSFPLLVFLWFVNGCLQSLIWTPIVRIIAVRFREAVRDHAAFFMSLTLIFGYLAAWGLSGLLTGLLSWRAAFLISGLVTACISVPALLKLRGAQDTSQNEDAAENRPASPVSRASLSRLFLHTNLLFLLAACFANGYVRDSITNWAAKLLMDTQGIDLGSAVGVMLIIPAVNYLGIRLGQAVHRKTGGSVYTASAIMFGFCTLFCFLLFPASPGSFVISSALLVMISAMSFGLNPLLTTLMPMLFRDLNRVAFSAGLMDACIYIGSSFSGSFAGFLSDRFGWTAVFLSWAILSLMGTGMVFLAQRAERHPD